MALQIECPAPGCATRNPESAKICRSCSAPIGRSRHTVWYVDERDGKGKRQRVRVGVGRAAAQRVADQVRATRFSNPPAGWREKQAVVPSLGVLAAEYLAHPKIRAQRGYRDRSYVLRAVVRRLGENTPADELTPQAIHRYQEVRRLER